MKNQKWPLAIAISSAIMLSGCLSSGGGSSSKGGNEGTGTGPTTTPQALSFEGTAAKGIVLGGVVKARALTANGDRGAVLAQTTTSTTDGSYKLTLAETYDGAPVLIEVSATNGTLVRCDLAVCVRDGQGNASITFGEDFTAPSDFELTALVPKVTADTKLVNATPLTSVAANLAFDIFKGSPSAQMQDVILRANAQIEDRFKLQGNLLQLKVIDITDPKNVAAADANVNRYNLISAAVASSPTKNMIEALASFVEEFVQKGIADTSAPGAQGITLEKILEQALQIATLIEKEAVRQSVDLGNSLAAARTVIDNARSEAANNGSTEPSQGEAAPGVGSEGLVAVKQFVQQIRDLANLVSLEENLLAFQEEVDLISQLNDAETRVVTKATGAVLRAIAQAEEEVQNGSTSTAFDFDGVRVVRSGKNYSVKQTLSLAARDDEPEIKVNVDVNAAGSLQSVTTQTGDSDYWWQNSSGSFEKSTSAKAELTLAGEVSGPTVTFSIREGSRLKGTFSGDTSYNWDSSYEYQSSEGSRSEYWSSDENTDEKIFFSDLSASLNATLVAKGAAPFTFTGSLTLDLDSLKLIREESEYYSQQRTWRMITIDGQYAGEEDRWSSYTEDRSYWNASVNGLGLSLSGTFTNPQNQLKASATLSADKISGGCESLYASGWREDTRVWNNYSDCTFSDLEGGPAIVNLAVTFEMALHGMSHPMSVTVSAQNKGLDSVIGSAALNYKDGQRLKMDYAGKEGDTHKATLTNHNDVVLALAQTKTSSGKALNGTISWQGKQYATVDNTRGVRVKYTDGTTEYY